MGFREPVRTEVEVVLTVTVDERSHFREFVASKEVILELPD
jgi:hypothetical protein